jgi:hypothetical protein
MDQAIVGAERVCNDISKLETKLKMNIATMAELLDPKRTREAVVDSLFADLHTLLNPVAKVFD